MSPTVTLTGALPFAVVIASVLAVPVSLLLLALYRKAVQKGMSSIGGETSAGPERSVIHRRPSSSLHFQTFDHSANQFPRDTTSSAYRRAVEKPWQTAKIYTAAGACYAAIMTAGYLAAHHMPFVWTLALFLFWQYFWPVVIAIVLVAAYDRARRQKLFAGYFFVLFALSLIGVARNPKIDFAQLFYFWILANGPPSVLVVAFLWRPIRAVGPLVLSFLIMVSIGSHSILLMADANKTITFTIYRIGLQLGLDSMALFISIILLGALLFGLAGWPLLRFLGRLYEKKKLSDQSIMLDALWFLFGVVQSIEFVFEGPRWILTGLVAFVGYKLISRLGFRWTNATRPTSESRTLLLLRVFALGKRSEQLFDKLRKHWQYAGSISMIAGPDLITATVEPHEFLEFVRGRLARRFVSSAQDLERRIALPDGKPDPDGRYRIKEFFCHDDTWQMTMERLAATSDSVIMDLRSFSLANQGCIFELGRLLDSMDLGRVVFLIDSTTNLGFLEETLQRLWQNLSADSPNQAATEPSGQLFPIVTQSEKELGALLRLLMSPVSATVAIVLVGMNGPIEGKEFVMKKNGLLIGRNRSNDLVILEDDYVSGSHAYLHYDKGDLLIIDRNSSNGTFVNEKKLTDTGCVLTSGDHIRVGNSILEVRMTSS